MANQFLALSLFIMLLSFFIILNSMSNFEPTKSTDVLDSLSKAFATSIKPADEDPNPVEDPMQSQNRGDALDLLEELFTSRIAQVKTHQNRLGTILTVQVPYDAFAAALSSPDGQKGTFGAALLSLMQEGERGPFRMEMILNMDQSPGDMRNERPARLEDQRKKVAELARRLQDMGLSQRLLSSGLSAGSPDMLTLVFQSYLPYSPVSSASEMQEAG